MGRRSCSGNRKLRKGLWSPEEDEKLYKYVTRFGVGCWSSVPKLAGLERCGKSCRLRWINYLRPDLKRGMFSQQEEDIIINLHEALGNKWAQIAQQFPGRTDNEIKNFWNSSLKKKLMKLGIDPATHKPITTEIKDDNGDFIMNSTTDRMFPNLVASNRTKHQSYHLNNTNEGLIMHHDSRNNFPSKQVYDPLFLSEFQSTIDPSNILTNFQQNPINGFNAMPNFSNFGGNQNMRMDNTDYYSNSSKLSALFFMNEAKESSSTSVVENPSTFFWDAAEDNKLESVFQFQFSGTQNQELKPTQLPQFHNPCFEEDHSNFQGLTGTNMDVFEQL